MFGEWLYLISAIACVSPLAHRKPATVLQWEEKCLPGSLALNDCNWCKCTVQRKYSCHARVCHEVDVFGHFNDAIAAINVGMEGRGVWRSSSTACEPGVLYRRSDLVCVCSEDGTWPNPVCRDFFRVLHPVQATDEVKPNHQKCSPTKLYLIGCNVCYCPSTGEMDPEMCTKKTCTGEDDILEIKEEYDDKDGEDLAIYATCTADATYKLGCQNCVCLKNNRLYCDKCSEPQTLTQSKKPTSHCDNVDPGDVYTADCNLCVCDKNGYSYCTVKKCLQSTQTSRAKFNLEETHKDPNDKVTEKSTYPCEPGSTTNDKCRNCTCNVYENDRTSYACSYNSKGECRRPRWENYGAVPMRDESRASIDQTLKLLNSDCVKNTIYEHNCFVCSCFVNDNGDKQEICASNPKCENATVQDLTRTHGYCKPLHVYKKDCNVCKCLADGKTSRCTSKICKAQEEPITVDVVPMTQMGAPCSEGSSYKIDCNVCFCLSNGNAICTTIHCKKSHLT